ncbi:GDP-mannose-dependent alpha-(1-6)-phosphatidylinositol monomannoside mannosyltransferase [Paenibacillus sp. JJ-100]|uniref:glycosyltransferase family 4 protein n=1 Tax=Paenibacillus sp. JJ-100 TaxID=2974896 RepID=UPI0022FF4E8E|nr:glycosyltransferase family 4 protein [Paenibacillus sp. JJ-100]CAI6082068.1 GDP-mannose-dependent alpha-(1-6)-phosphatidylinositol monomannoside mannosyltransferase [Paenibacillus sp. JJ-100]
MNKVFVAIDFPPEKGGIHDYAFGLISQIPAEETIVLTNKINNAVESEQFDQKSDFQIIRKRIFSDSNKRMMIFSQLILLMQLILLKWRKNTKEIHFVNIFPVGLAGPLMKFLFRVKYFPYVHGLDVMGMVNSRLFPLLLFILKRADKVIANSQYTKSKLVELGIAESQIVIIPPGLNVNKLSADTGSEEDIRAKYDLHGKKVMITVSRLVERKGHDVTLKAVSHIVKRIPNLKYVICGDGPYKEELERLVIQYGLDSVVVFTGRTTDHELHQLYECSDLFIMPSRDIKEKGDVEGFGIVFLEANYYRLPVIAGNSGGIPDAVKDNITGYLVDPVNDEEIAMRIEQLITDEGLARTMGDNGYDWVTNHCLWSHRGQLLKQLA